MKKIIVSIIIIGFLFTTSLSSVAVFGINEPEEEQGFLRHSILYADIYVDDDNTAGPWDGTLEYPYQHIEDGINAANPGDTVFVFNGIYYNEDIDNVTKPIKLLGEDKYNTIIDAPYLQVYEVNGFELRNFCLGCSTPNIYLGDCSHCIISGNTIPLTGTHGIVLSGSSNCTVSDNIIHCSGSTCIYVKGSNNEIKDNYLSGSNYLDRGIEIRYDSNDTVVANNTICNLGGDGIYLDEGCNRVCITDNVINNIGGNGLNLHSSNLAISRNKITNSSYCGISLSYTDDVLVSDNIIKNTRTGIEVLFGHTSDGWAKNIIISGNIIDNAVSDGISLGNVADSVFTNNTITNVSGNDEFPGYGIYVGTVKNILFSYNTINNCEFGIYLDESSYLDQLGPIVTFKNNIVSYNDYGVVLYGRTFFSVITKNEIRNNDYGVVLASYIILVDMHFPFENWIVANNISENYYGVYATDLTSSNHIYYNNFIDNYQNAYDNGTNIWYKYKLLGQSMGNYWDDYTGSDNNGDGIGDSPYDVPPLPFRNKDRYPCMEPIDIGNIASSYCELIQSNSQPSTQPSSQPVSKTATQTITVSTTPSGKTATK